MSEFAKRKDVIVLGLPRGGVPVAYEVAKALHVPLDVFVVRKLGLPGQEELAMGAIASGGTRVLNEELLKDVPISAEAIQNVTETEMQELERREELYRGQRPKLNVSDKTVLLVDDGLATGSTVRAAIRALRQLGPRYVIVAVPVGSRETCRALRREADDVICALIPEQFYAVGYWYVDFQATSDEEVQKLLTRTPDEAIAHRLA